MSTPPRKSSGLRYYLVQCGPLEAIDDQHVDGPTRRFELQSELLFDGRVDRWRIRIDRWQLGAGWRRKRHLVRIHGELQIERPGTGEASAIEHGSSHELRERVDQRAHREAVAGEHPETAADP